MVHGDVRGQVVGMLCTGQKVLGEKFLTATLFTTSATSPDLGLEPRPQRLEAGDKLPELLPLVTFRFLAWGEIEYEQLSNLVVTLQLQEIVMIIFSLRPQIFHFVSSCYIPWTLPAVRCL
jgi:hypothetical protein